ncbi:MAG: hypothetical protein JSW34_02110, partial [Candidatus Zixiibacteriota bacterium]
DLGYMLNVGRRDALGASLAVITNYEGNADTYAALKPRYRRWLSRDFALEIGLGLGIHGRESDPEGLPLIAQLDLTFRDYFSVTLLAERFRWTESVWDNAAGRMIDGDSHTAMTFSAGVTAGSYPGLVAAGVALVVALSTINTTVY